MSTTKGIDKQSVVIPSDDDGASDDMEAEDPVPMVHKRRRHRIVRANRDCQHIRSRLRAQIEARQDNNSESDCEDENLVEIEDLLSYLVI